MAEEAKTSLTIKHIESLIEYEHFDCTPKVITCTLHVGDAAILGHSYCFDLDKPDYARGKASARKAAIDELFRQEAYHQKRLRQQQQQPAT